MRCGPQVCSGGLVGFAHPLYLGFLCQVYLFMYHVALLNGREAVNGRDERRGEEGEERRVCV